MFFEVLGDTSKCSYCDVRTEDRISLVPIEKLRLSICAIKFSTDGKPLWKGISLESPVI